MNWEAIMGVLAILGVLGTIIVMVYKFGGLTKELEVLKDRVCEDREKNSDQHTEFYKTRDSVTGLSTELAGVNRRLERVEEGVDELLRRIPVKIA